jgi:hypothetical protein
VVQAIVMAESLVPMERTSVFEVTSALLLKE